MVFGFSNEAISDNSPKGGFLHSKPVLEKLATRRVLYSCLREVQKNWKNSKNLKSLFSWFLAVFSNFNLLKGSRGGTHKVGGVATTPVTFIHTERQSRPQLVGVIVVKSVLPRFRFFLPHEVGRAYRR